MHEFNVGTAADNFRIPMAGSIVPVQAGLASDGGAR